MNETELNRRRKVVGASEVGLLFGFPSFGGRTLSDLWFEKRHGTVPGNKWNASTSMGHKLEPIVLGEAEDRLGVPIVDRQKWCTLGVNGATLDGRLENDGAIVEAKTCGILWADKDTLAQWGDDGSDEVPDLYLMQVQCQLLVTGAELGYLAALLGGRGFAMYQIQPQKDLQHAIAMKSAEFLASVEADEMPAEPPQMETMKRVRRQPAKVLPWSDEIQEAYELFESAKANAKLLDGTKEAAQRKLLSLFGDAEAVQVKGGLLTFKEQTRKETLVAASTFRVLRFQKGA